MARSVYITGPAGGLPVVALGVTHLLSRRVSRLAVFRPVVTLAADPVLELLRERYQIPAESAGFGATAAEAVAVATEQLVGQVLERYRAVTAGADAVVVVGDADRDGGAAFETRLAREFGAAMLPVVDARHRTPEAVTAAVRAAYQALAELGATVVAVVANRTNPGAERPDGVPVPVYAIPDVPAVSAPTLADVAERLGAERLLGDDDAYGRDALHFVVGGAHVPVFLPHLRDGCVVITPGDRSDLVVAAVAAHAAGVAAITGIVLTLGERPDERVLGLVRGLRTNVPVVSVRRDSFETVAATAGLEGRLVASDTRKTEAALAAFESGVDGRELVRRLDVARSDRVTPLMFEHRLIDRARRDRRHVVLPEGTEERILRAAEVLLRRGVAELTLLGPPAEVGRRARELGLDMTGATVVDPVTSPWRADFAEAYAKLRAHKGVTLDAAADIMVDPNYFGTMMVHLGHADAMVSGSTHPTADTIRPAFEIIKTRPGVSVASSAFFMCLADHVLVYADCAVNPDPDAEQLADIAISSARTAARFGVEPRVAMLSYSTGTSGHGADVDKVAAATALVREREPDLPVEGPIQYDAAIVPSVARTKLPDSPVAGRATVLIFPDLNTGNNTYKAVQRSAGAVAVGPVLQGLRRPVNDLSRGATVPDIVNTVAITAIQAQDR